MTALAANLAHFNATDASAPAVECRGVTYRYARAGGGIGVVDDAPALRGITLSVRVGERLGILGPNGGGKSTLVKLILGLLPCQSGELSVFGQPPHEARKKGLIGYVPQRVEAELAFPLSVRQVVAMSAQRGLMPWMHVDRTRQGAIENAIEVVGLSSVADRAIGKLSGGQLQRAMIARALAGRPRILFLDEPTVGVDVGGQQRFAELLDSLHKKLGLTIVIVSHDIRVIAAGCDRVACLSRTLHFHDTPQGLTPKVLAEVFRHDVAGIFGDVHVVAHVAGSCPPGCAIDGAIDGSVDGPHDGSTANAAASGAPPADSVAARAASLWKGEKP